MCKLCKGLAEQVRHTGKAVGNLNLGELRTLLCG